MYFRFQPDDPTLTRDAMEKVIIDKDFHIAILLNDAVLE